MTWPEEYGGGGGEGVYEYHLTEALARVGATQIGKGWILNGQKISTTSARFAEWSWLGVRTTPPAIRRNSGSSFASWGFSG
jgi:alkylation response protein AidB-like acyl-CoA dehydrogenase